MPDYVKCARSIITNLETIQRQIGQAQVELLGILTDENEDEWDQSAQLGLVKLESVQKGIGEVQVLLFERLPLSTTAIAVAIESTSAAVDPQPQIIKPQQPITSYPDPQQWLEIRNIKIKALAPASGIDQSADGAALYLGDHFERLEGFLYAIKRAVLRGDQQSWFSVIDLPAATIGAICQFATKLHGAGFLTDFRYKKRSAARPNQKPGIEFAPLDDKRVHRFFNGGWLERYVEQVVKEISQKTSVRGVVGPMLREVQVELPTGCDAEFDLLAALGEGRMVWIEAKSGQWRQHVPRLKELNERFLKLPQNDAALVVAERLADEEKASLSSLSGMTVVHLTELRQHLGGS